MAGRISPDDAKIMADVLTDEDQLGQLTPGQIRSITGKLMQFQEEQQGRRADMVSQGHTADEAEALVTRENETLNSGADTQGGTFKKNGPPGQFQAFHVAKALNAGTEGAWRAVEGLGDLVNEVGVGLNLQSREDADRYKEVVRQDRFKRKMSDMDMFGSMNSTVAEFIGEIIPWVATGAVGGGAGILRYGLSQAVVGALAGTAQVSEEHIEDRWNEALVGGGLGAAIPMAMGTPAWGRRWAARKFMKELNLETSQNNIELEGAIQQMLQDGNFSFSLAQVTGNRFIFGLEQSAAGHAQKAAQNKNIQMLFDHLLDQSKKLGAAGKSGDDIAYELRATLEKANKSIHKKASTEFESNLNAIESEYGDDIILDFDGGHAYLDQLEKHLDELSDPLRPGVKASASFKGYRDEIDRLVNPVQPKKRIVEGADGKKHTVWDLDNRRTNIVDQAGYSTQAEAKAASLIQNESLGGLQAGEINRVTKGLNDMLAGRTAVVEGSGDVAQDKAISKGLMGVLTRNLKANNTNQAAVDALETMRESYKGHMLIVGDLERLVVNRHFGQASGMPTDPDAALDVVLASGSTSLQNTRKFLEEWEPALLGDLQATFIRRMAEKSRDFSLPAVDVPINPTKMANNLGGAKGIGMKGFGLFDPATQADLVKTGKALRTIKNLYFTGIVQGGSKIDDLAINIISQSPEFMARFITRALSGGQRMSNALLDPLLRKSIQNIAEGSIDTPKGRAAMVTLVHFITQQDKIDAAKEKSATQGEQARTISQASPQRAGF